MNRSTSTPADQPLPAELAPRELVGEQLADASGADPEGFGCETEGSFMRCPSFEVVAG